MASVTQGVNAMGKEKAKGFRTPLSEKIFLDRYALKSPDRDAFSVGDTVVFSPSPNSGFPRREIGRVEAIDELKQVATLVLRDDAESERYMVPFEHVDTPLELDYSQLCGRVAKAIASVEGTAEQAREASQRFEGILKTQDFVPGGRILAGAGAPGDLTYYNCFVVPSPRDSRAGILETAQQQFEIMSRGGGVGINVSSLRPRYDYVKGVNGRSSGAVSWADLYSIITGKVEQGGSRRGALMIILDIWHPDVEDFIVSKHQIGNLDNANISVGLTDDFMAAVEADGSWDLRFPDREDPDYDTLWRGDLGDWAERGKPVVTYRSVRARELFNGICKSAWRSAEPGLFFVDRYNKMANSHYYTNIRCTNPCGEQGLPAWGVCNLGALNLGNFVRPTEQGGRFWSHVSDDATGSELAARIDYERLAETTCSAVHFLDNVIDKTPYVMDENERQQKSERRVGLGVMGLAEMLIRAGVRYGSKASVEISDKIFETMRDSAYAQSTELARRKGSFPRFDAEGVLSSGFAQTLPADIKQAVRTKGLRNVTLTTIAPTGTTGSMISTSTGIEPYFMFRFEQRGHLGAHIVEEPIVREYRDESGCQGDLPPHFVVTEDLGPDEHVGIMATAQKYIDSSISKTCNLPADFTVEQVERFYLKLYELGCKGGTVYRDGCREEQCLVKVEDAAEGAQDSRAEAFPVAPEVAPVVVEAPRPEVKPMPNRPRLGLTHSVTTHLGRVHVTLNLDGDTGDLFDVFIRLSKAGSDIDADTDAIGRLVSLMLRIDSSLKTTRRLELCIAQLRGIASSQSVGFGPNRVRSVPDAIALCFQTLIDRIEELEAMRRLERSLRAGRNEESQLMFESLFGGPGSVEEETIQAEVAAPPPVDNKAGTRGFILMCPACGCASAVKADGCFKCVSCGYSEC